MNKLLTIGMAVYDDFDGVYFTVQSLLLYHSILKKIDYEIIIVDNNSTGTHSDAIKRLAKNIKHCKYISYSDRKSTAIRNEIFTHSKGKYTLAIDCHVLINNGGIDALLDYFSEHNECKDIISGIMLYDNHKDYSTHFDPYWRGGMYGIWGKNKVKYELGKPFEIPMMGLGLFACETKYWQGFNTKFKGFGGEEGYIHEKFRRAGGKAICIPTLQWLHRFDRPNKVPYPVLVEDRIWNYFIGWLEITQDPNHPMIKNIYHYFTFRLQDKTMVENIFKKAKKYYHMI